MKNLIYIIALACLVGCRSYNEGLKTLIFEKETSNSVEPHISHILLNVPEKYIIGDISQIYEMGDKIIVLQSDTRHCGAYIFNKSGQFVAKVGNCGRANGEYLSADFVTIDGDKIVIFDQSRGYALRYQLITHLLTVKRFLTRYFMHLLMITTSVITLKRIPQNHSLSINML